MTVQMEGLARRLVSANLINETEAIAVFEQAAAAKRPFVSQLVSSNLLGSKSIAVAAAEEFGIPFLDLAAYDLNHIPRQLVDAKLIKKHNVLPLFRRANRLYLAVSDPGNINAFDEIKFHTGISNDIIVVEEEKLAVAIVEYINLAEAKEGSIAELEDVALDELSVETAPLEIVDVDAPAIDETPIVRFVNKVLLDAIRIGASDIHIEFALEPTAFSMK
jgi:type IV pilus assembly protein PilB